MHDLRLSLTNGADPPKNMVKNHVEGLVFLGKAMAKTKENSTQDRDIRYRQWCRERMVALGSERAG